jgi:hypothetical protein
MAGDFATIAVIAAFFTPLLLIAVYTVTAPWWTSRVGRTLVTVEAAISLAVLPPFAHRVTSPSSVPDVAFTWFQTVTWGILALVLLHMTWVIIATQRHGVPAGQPELQGASSSEREGA